jgi:hypothetical protein
MICKYCGKPIVLHPSAKERAKKFGGRPGDYTRLFTSHSSCAINAREKATRELMARKAVELSRLAG